MAASLVLLALGLVILATGLHRQLNAAPVGGPPVPTVQPRTTAHDVTPTDPDVTRTTPPPSAGTPRVPRALPVRLSIPAIRLSVPLGRLGMNPDRTVQVPADPALPGWYRLGAAPGEVGSAVILGHVDSTSGPAVFYQLSVVHPGDRVTVRSSDGSMAHFMVTGVRVYPAADFPRHRVYASPGYSAIRLITCGGGFDSSTQHYLGNIVVYGSLISRSNPA